MVRLQFLSWFAFCPAPGCAVHERSEPWVNASPGDGISPARAREAAHQLINRTHQITRRKFPAEEKIRIVLAGIRAEAAVSHWSRKPSTQNS